ncbi:hypothetical protein IWZ00DRAFT_132972 [Phyllosticta capitalensis]
MPMCLLHCSLFKVEYSEQSLHSDIKPAQNHLQIGRNSPKIHHHTSTMKSNSTIETIAIRERFGDRESMLWEIGRGHMFARDTSGAMVNVRSAIFDHLRRVTGAAADELAAQLPVHREQDEQYDADVSSNGNSSAEPTPELQQVGQGQSEDYDADVSNDGSPIPGRRVVSPAQLEVVEQPGLEVAAFGLGITGVQPAELEAVERPVELETVERPVEMPAVEQPLRPEHLLFIAEEFGDEEAHRWYEGRGRPFARNRDGEMVLVRAEVFEYFALDR